MADTKIDDELIAAAYTAQREHRFRDPTTCRCGFEPGDFNDWERHRLTVALGAAESRGRTAGYAEAVMEFRTYVEANFHPASGHGTLLRSVVSRMEKLAASRETTDG